jgi:hypothetical protein
MSDVEIHYNSGRVPVSGTGPTPYISLSDEVISYGDRWGLANRIVLNGVITGSNFNSLYVAQSGLISLFSTSYKELTVYEGPDGAVGYAGNGGAPNVSYSGVYTFSGCSVDKISFDQAGYNKVVGYSVELLSYPSGLSGFFSGVYGVLDPKDEIRISEGNDGFATISHIVSARGFVTNSIHTAVNNAKNYVASRTGISNILSVPIISGIENTGAFTPVLVSLSENLDRLNLTYSIEEGYKFKMYTGDTEAANDYSFNNYYLTSYSTSLSSGAGDDFVTASIRGEIKAGITGSTGETLVSELITQLSGLNPYAVVSNKYGAPNGLSFCQDPIQFTIEEDLKSRSLKFNASYDNLEFYSSNDKYVFSGCYLDASISHSIDPLSSVDTIQVKGDIKCRGSVTNRYNSSLLYLGQLMTAGSSASYPRMYDFVNDYYSSYYSAGSKFAINSTPTSLIVNANPLLGTISIEATFDNRDRFSSLSASDYSIEYTPYNTIYAYASSCNQPSKHMAVDINIKKREKASINLSVSGPASTEKNLIDAKDTIFTAFVDNFVKGLIVDASSLNTLQIEDSVLSLMNSTTTTPLGTTIGSTINSSKIYSYELKESERALRPVIKSRS